MDIWDGRNEKKRKCIITIFEIKKCDPIYLYRDIIGLCPGYSLNLVFAVQCCNFMKHALKQKLDLGSVDSPIVTALF